MAIHRRAAMTLECDPRPPSANVAVAGPAGHGAAPPAEPFGALQSRRFDCMPGVPALKTLVPPLKPCLSIALAISCGLAAPAHAATSYSVASPGGAITLTVAHDAGSGTLSYSVARNGVTEIESSPLGLVTSVADFSSGLAFVSRVDKAIDQRYALPGHKKATYANRANEMTLHFKAGGQKFDLVARASDDGIAYRYVVPGTGTLGVGAERSAFNLPDAAGGWAQSYVTTYEGLYSPRASFGSGSFGMPVLVHNGNDWLLLSESDIGSNDFASHLEGGAGNTLRVAPAADATVTTTRPFNGPWRLAVIGGLDTIVASTLVENLSTGSQVADTSWIAPGRSAWSWRAGGVQSDFTTHLPYIDEAAALGWEYYLADEGWQDSWAPSLVDYGRARNVGIVLWVNQRDVDTEAKARTLFSKWAGWGVKGVKVDFFEGDSQAVMAEYETLARVAADNRLMVDFHGATKPNGLMRKWPNILTQEAVFGAEQGGLPASHDVSLVFTRNAIGPMDFTPINFSTAAGHSTWAHQVALAVVYSSYLQHFADHWAAYRDSVAVDFLRTVPSVWDDTRLIEGLPDQFATIARRRGAEWYVGAIAAGDAARTATIPLSFLKPGLAYTAEIYQDGGSDNDIARKTQVVTSTSVLALPLRANGGAAVRLTTQAAPSALPNLAAGKAATADSACAPNEGANKAFNGSVAGGTGDKWCSGGAAKWLEVDLGGVYTVSQFALRHAGAGGEDAAWNTRDFRIETSTDNTTWSTAVDVTGNTADWTNHVIVPRGARYVRLDVTNGAQPGQGNVARIYDLEVYGRGQFDTSATYRIVNRNSGKVLAVQDASTADGAVVVQWDYADATSNDEWRLVEAGGGYYDLVNHWSGKALDVNGALTTDGTALIQFTSRGSANQQWQLADTDSGYVRITSRNSGKVVDVYDKGQANGAAVIQYTWNGGANQQWQLVPVAGNP